MNHPTKKSDPLETLFSFLGAAMFISLIRKECKQSKFIREKTIDALEKFIQELKTMK